MRLDRSHRQGMALARRGAALLYARGARRVWVFGSLAQGRTQDRFSDIDLAADGLSAWRRDTVVAELVHELRSPVDLILADAVRPDLRASVLRDAVLLDRADEAPSMAEVLAPARTLYQHRLLDALAALRESGAASVVDLGCGQAWLVELLASSGGFERVGGLDLSDDALRTASERMRVALTATQRARVTLAHALLTHRQPALLGYDAAVAMELIEHLEPPQRAAFEHVLFGYASPATVVVTTPNREYNARWRTRCSNGLRSEDHRFEWTRREFASWAESLAHRYGYGCTIRPVGPVDAKLGSPTQMAIFQR